MPRQDRASHSMAQIASIQASLPHKQAIFRDTWSTVTMQIHSEPESSRVASTNEKNRTSSQRNLDRFVPEEGRGQLPRWIDLRFSDQES